MHGGRLPDGGSDAHPESDSGNFTERNAGLRHAKGAGIHAEEEHLFGGGGESADIGFVACTSVDKWIVGESHWRSKRELLHGIR